MPAIRRFVFCAALACAALPGAGRAATGTGPIATVAGNGTAGSSGNGGPPLLAAMQPSAVAVDGSGNLYVAEPENHVVRRISPLGRITAFAGTGVEGATGDGGPADQAQLGTPSAVAVDAAGTVYIAERFANVVRRVDPQTHLITRFAGGGPGTGEGGPATQARLAGPVGLAAAQGILYIAEFDAARVVSVGPGGTVSLVVGTGAFVPGGSGVEGPARQAALGSASGVAADAAGNVYVADPASQRIWRVDRAGILHAHAGGGTSLAEDAPALEARLTIPWGVAADGQGNVYVADTEGHRVHRIHPVAQASATRSTVAGVGTAGFSGDGGPAGTAALSRPFGVAADAGGNVFIADTGNLRVRKATNAALLADLSVHIERGASSVTRGRETPFLVVAANRGPQPAGRVMLASDPPGPPALIEASSTSGSCTGSPPLCALGVLPAGSDATVTLVVAPQTVGSYCQSVRVYAPAQGDPAPDDNVAAAPCMPVVEPFRADQFVVLTQESLALGTRSYVASGALGSSQDAQPPVLPVSLTAPLDLSAQTFVVGRRVGLDGVHARRVYTDRLEPAHGGGAQDVLPPGSFPILDLPTPAVAVPGTQPVTLAAGETRALGPGSYADVEVGPRATLLLRGWTQLPAHRIPLTRQGYDFRSLRVRDRGRVLFIAPPRNVAQIRLGVAVRVQRTVLAGKGVTIGPQLAGGPVRPSHVVFHIAADENDPSTGPFALQVGAGGKFGANVLAPLAGVQFLLGTDATGAFLARRFQGEGVRLTLDSAFR